MTTNAIAPWEGTLEWVGTPNSGSSQGGKKWMSVDFALKYKDHRMNEKMIVFSAFGADMVDKILPFPHGSELRVVWWPSAVQGKRDGRYFGKNDAIQVSLVNANTNRSTDDARTRDEQAEINPEDLPF